MKRYAYSAPVTILFALLAADVAGSAPANPWTVVSVRECKAEEIPFEEARRNIWPFLDANNVAGPDSLMAHVRTNEKHHAYIELEDLRTGKASLLLDANACLPHWSPDGKYIGCVVWKSHRQYSQLTVVDVAARTVLIDPGMSVDAMRWSADSRTLVAGGRVYASPYAILYTVSVPDGKVTVLDTIDAGGGHEFSYSPDGRWIAFTRPTELDSDENPVASDLWIADAESRTSWLVLETPDWIESNPLWITTRTIQLDRVHWDGAERGVEQRVVIELANDESK